MLGVAVSVSLPWSAWAGTTVIENTVNASASTGGNSVGSGGKVIQGESKAQVKIYTEIDGEVVTDIDETVTAPVGEDAVIEKSVEVNLPSVQSSTSVKAEASGGIEQETENEIGQKNIEPEKRNFIIAFLSNIFKYVFSIF